jgi:hypothetical protein
MDSVINRRVRPTHVVSLKAIVDRRPNGAGDVRFSPKPRYPGISGNFHPPRPSLSF